MTPAVRYYCPPGVMRPAHRADLMAAVGLYDGHGPDVATGGPGGGVVFGGVYTDGEPGWQLTSEGWWLHLGGALPQHLVRLRTHPAIVRWANVRGARDGHLWRIPVLLTPGEEVLPDGGVLYTSALERTWRGDEGWATPADLEPVQRRIFNVAHNLAVADGTPDGENAAYTALIIELMQLGHCVSRHEIVQGGWLTEMVMLRVFVAAADVRNAPPEAAPVDA